MQGIIELLRRRPALARALTAAAVLLVCVAYVALVGVSVDASGLGARVEDALTQRLGRAVRIDSGLRIHVSARPYVVVRGVHIANAAGFAGEEFAHLGEARLALDLWPLLRLRLRVEEVSGRDVRLRLQRRADGSNNWTFAQTDARAGDAQVTAADRPADVPAAQVLARLEIGRIALDALEVEFIGPDTRSHYFALQSLVARFPEGQAVTLALRGTIENSYPYHIELTGGTLADLGQLDKPWPLALSLGFMSSSLSLDGSVSGHAGQLRFGIGTENLHEFERLFQTHLPAVDVVGVAGVLTYGPGKLALEDLNGVMGKTTLQGDLAVEFGGERPKVRGELNLPTLDLRPFLTEQAPARDEPPRTLAQMYRELATVNVGLEELKLVDADLGIRVGQWLSLPGSVQDAKLHIALEGGRLTVPVQAVVADVGLSGSIRADAKAVPPRFDLTLGTHDSSLGNLAELLLGIPNVRGSLGRFDLHIASRGNQGSELVRSLAVQLQVSAGQMSYGNGPGQHPVKLRLDEMHLVLPPGKPLAGEAHGTLVDTPFGLRLQGATLSDLLQQAHARLDLHLWAGQAQTWIHALIEPPTQDAGSEVSFDLDAPHAREIAAWLGLKSGADAAVALHGKVQASSRGWHLSETSLRLGRSTIAADLLRNEQNGTPLVTVKLDCELIDAEELQSLLPERGATAAGPASADILDLPILPQGINLAQADIAVRIKRIATRTPFTVRDLAFDGRIRDGIMSVSPFSANVAQADFRGAIFLDLRSQEPQAGLWLSTGHVDIGAILQQLGIVRKLDAAVDQLRVHLDLHSSRLGQMAAQSELELHFQGGHLAWERGGAGGKLEVAIDSGDLESAPGAPVHLDLNGSLDKVAVAIGVQTARAAELLNPALPIPVNFHVSTAGAVLNLAGEIARPVSERDLSFSLDIQGERLNALDALVHTALPPWGPWSVSGKFHISNGGYEMSSMLMQVGSSWLNGHGTIDMTAVPPRIELALTAPTIQLDDFRFNNWSPEASKAGEGGAAPESADDLRSRAAQGSDHVQQILSPQALRRQNASLDVRVEHVISGKDVLGEGELQATIDGGRVVLGPLAVHTPGGSATVRLGYKPGDTSVGARLRIDIENFDYGILARHLDPDTEMSGIFSLDVDLHAHAGRISELLRHGQGHIDFAVWPENLKSGLLDVWAVNVLMALLPAVDSAHTSKVNCAIGRFILNDGQLSEKTILIDTSRMRVTGKGKVDFSVEDVRVNLQPHAKTPQFLSFAVPIQLSGKFNDFHVGVDATDVLETVAQLATSVIWVPIESLFGKKTPADGRDVCGKEFRKDLKAP